MKIPELNEEKTQRLTFARYLLSQAKIHQNKAHPLSSFTILIIHDLVEIFLQVALEVHLPKISKPTENIIVGTGNKLNDYLHENNQQPISSQFLKRINHIRNPLKHTSIFADQSTINKIYTECEIFFSDFTKILFGLDADRLSLTTLIRNENMRLHLSQAEMFVSRDKSNHAMVEITKAYHYLLHTELAIKKDFGVDLTRDHRFYSLEARIRNRSSSIRSDAVDGTLRTVVQEVTKDINDIYQRLSNLERAVSLGVDYKTFLKFNRQLPHIYRPSTADTDTKLYFWNTDDESIAKLNYTQENTNFCFDFMLNVIFRIEGQDS